MPRDGNGAGLCRMPIDFVASFSALQVPAVLLNKFGDITIFHLHASVYLTVGGGVARNNCLSVGDRSRGEAGAAAAGFGGVGVDEVEALAHEGFFVIEDHAREVEIGRAHV